MNTTTEDGEVLETPVFFKTPYNHNVELESLRTALYCKDPSKTIQSQAAEADINNIVKNFGITGMIPQINLPPSLDEFGEAFDFQSAMNVVAAANHSFSQLPAEVRTAFNNDPHRFVATVDEILNDQEGEQKRKNMEALRAMGLAVAPGPIADKTTLGDVLKAIKEQGAPKAPPDA